MDKKNLIALFSLLTIPGFLQANSIKLNKKINLIVKKSISVRDLLLLLFPNYNILAVDNESFKALKKKVKNVDYKNMSLKYILKSLEYKINAYIEVDDKNKIIRLQQYKVFRYHVPVNGPISISTKVTLGTGGGTPPAVNENELSGGSGTAGTSNTGMQAVPMMGAPGMGGPGMGAPGAGAPGMGGPRMMEPGMNPMMGAGAGNGQQNSGGQQGTGGGQQGGGGSGGGSSPDTGGSTIVIQDTGIGGLIKVIKSILSPDEKLYFDIKTGLLQLMVKPQTEVKINELLKPILNVRREQIKVTMKVIEFTRNKTEANGVSWSKFWNNIVNGVSLTAAFNMLKVNNSFGTISTTKIPQSQFAGTLSGSSSTVTGFLGLLSQFGNIKVLSEPSVVLRNGETVIINNGQQISYIKQTQVTQGQNSNAINYIPGTLLDGFRLILNANIERVPGKPPKIVLFLAPILQKLSIEQVGNPQYGFIQLPKVDKRSISLYTTLENGDTMVIGGFKTIYENSTNNGVPILKDIPVLGNLFSYKEKFKKEKRILFIVTAQILNDNEN